MDSRYDTIKIVNLEKENRELKDKLHGCETQYFNARIQITALVGKISRCNMQIKDLRIKVTDTIEANCGWNATGLFPGDFNA